MVLKMLRSLTIALMSLIASEMCASYAQAATVTYYFEGEVNSIVTPWPTISTGTMISGTFTYDNSATPSSFGSGSGILLDNYYPAGVSYSFSIGGFSGTEDNSVVIGGVHYVVQHNTNSGYADAFEVGTYATTNVVSDGSMDFYISTFTLRLQDDTGSVFGDGSPPLSLSLADFTSATISCTLRWPSMSCHTRIPLGFRASERAVSRLTRTAQPSPVSWNMAEGFATGLSDVSILACTLFFRPVPFEGRFDRCCRVICRIVVLQE